jgi:hypothetical protein
MCPFCCNYNTFRGDTKRLKFRLESRSSSQKIYLLKENKRPESRVGRSVCSTSLFSKTIFLNRFILESGLLNRFIFKTGSIFEMVYFSFF